MEPPRELGTLREMSLADVKACGPQLNWFMELEMGTLRFSKYEAPHF